jgi:hypothetical protein
MKISTPYIVSLIAASGLLASAFHMRSLPVVVSKLHGNPTFRNPTAVNCEPGGVVSGVIRNDGNGWYAIEDEAHAPTNIRLVESDAHGIVIHFSFVADSINTFIVGSDETLMVAGIFSGASVDTDKARLVLTKAGFFGPVRTSPLWVNTQRFPWMNFWVYGRFTYSCD